MEMVRQRWANAFIETKRYDMLTSNIAECTNSLFKGARVYFGKSGLLLRIEIL